MTNHQQAQITWRDGRVPVSEKFDDPYFSITDGLAETRHVFLAGNNLPARFTEGFHIAELGFGTGLNMLTAWQAWLDAGMTGQLHFTSFEAFPMGADDVRAALTAFPELGGLAEPFVQAWGAGKTAFETDTLKATVITGDARRTLPEWDGKADAWFLDGFSPAKNPELWEAPLMHAVADHTMRQGTFATYTAAGFVRQALSDAGFHIERIKGFGRKRHMTIGTLT